MKTKTTQDDLAYRVSGFKRDNYSIKVTVLVGAEDLDRDPGGDLYAFATAHAEGIAGPDYCFISTENITHPVPDAAKNRLFMSDAELFAAVPEMNPKRPRRAAR